MLVIVGSKSDLIKGQIKNVEIHATFLNLDFNDVDFETSLSECLQKVREEVMAHKNLLSEQKQTPKSKQKKRPCGWARAAKLTNFNANGLF